MDPADRMNPGLPVQLFVGAQVPSGSCEQKEETAHDFGTHHRVSAQGKASELTGDGRFSRLPEVVFCNRKRRNVASSICDLQAHFLRAAANIIVHRFSNYGSNDPTAFVDKLFQCKLSYKFCTLPAVRDYINNSVYGIRDELRPQRIESISFAIVNDIEESLLEVNVDVFQTSRFYNRRLRGANPTPVRELVPKLCKTLFDLQQLQLQPKVERRLQMTDSRMTIRYVTVDGRDDEEDGRCPDGWEPVFPVPLERSQLQPWAAPVRNEFNQLQFHVVTSS